MFYDVTGHLPLSPVALRGGPPGGEGAAVQPGHQPYVSAAGGQRPGGPSHHPLRQVCVSKGILSRC